MAYFDHAGCEYLTILCLVCWHFLLRVQSEGFPVEMGEPKYGAMLPLERHSALWVQDGVVCLRLQKRKHRPRGSFL